MRRDGPHISVMDLVELVTGGVPPAASTWVGRHLVTCSRCGASVAWLAHTLAVLRTDDREDAPAGMVRRAVRLWPPRDADPSGSAQDQHARRDQPRAASERAEKAHPIQQAATHEPLPAGSWVYVTTDPRAADLTVAVTTHPGVPAVPVHITCDSGAAAVWVYVTDDPRYGGVRVYVLNPEEGDAWP